MTEKIDGGPIFPVEKYPAPWGTAFHAGMSLRDYFAACALSHPYTAHETDPDKIAEWAYQVADALLAERVSV